MNSAFSSSTSPQAASRTGFTQASSRATFSFAVWEVSDDDEKRLDAYEGCPTFYYKKNVCLPVKLASGKTKRLTAFVYIMHEERSLGIPSLAYIRTCEEGYRNFGFDLKYLDRAYMRSTKED